MCYCWYSGEKRPVWRAEGTSVVQTQLLPGRPTEQTGDLNAGRLEETCEQVTLTMRLDTGDAPGYQVKSLYSEQWIISISYGILLLVKMGLYWYYFFVLMPIKILELLLWASLSFKTISIKILPVIIKHLKQISSPSSMIKELYVRRTIWKIITWRIIWLILICYECYPRNLDCFCMHNTLRVLGISMCWLIGTVPRGWDEMMEQESHLNPNNWHMRSVSPGVAGWTGW